MTIFSLLRRGSSSLRNHLVFILIIFSLPMSAMFAVSSYQDGELTPLWTLWIFAVGTFIGFIVALVGWFIILPPILRRSKRKDD
jgi:hypothetical protein